MLVVFAMKAVYSDFIGRKSVLRVCYGIFERGEI